MNKKFYVSMMCADIARLEQEIIEFEQAGIDGFHMDIMDGQFVPNFALGIQDLEAVRKLTDIMVDAHLMITNPSKKIDLFLNLGLNLIYVHPESDNQIELVLDKIRQKQIQVGLAINPETSIESIKSLLPLVDKVLVMTVSPGFAGQKYIEEMDEKIKELVTHQTNQGFDIVVDGAISAERISFLSKMGVEGFVLGTSSNLFNKAFDRTETLLSLHQS